MPWPARCRTAPLRCALGDDGQEGEMSDRWPAIRAVLWMVVISTVGAPPAHAGENLIQASASLQARARVFVTGPRHAFMLGAFGGRLAVEKEPRTLDGAQLPCPAAVDADYAAHTQRGEG